MTWAIFEPEAWGHHAEYVRHLLVEDSTGGAVHLIVSEAFARTFWQDEGWREGIDPGRVTLHVLSAGEGAVACGGPLWRRALGRWRLLRRFSRATRVSDWVVTEMDLLQLPLALGLRLPASARIHGILYRPSIHYSQLDGYSAPHGERLREWRKRILYALMLRNPTLGTVFSIDTMFPPYARRAFRSHGHKVRPLLDPVPAPAGASSPLAVAGPFTFLLFGAISRRKGVVELMKALPLLSPAARVRARVVVAGRIDGNVRAEFTSLLGAVRALSPPVEIEVRDGFIEERALRDLVRTADVILAPYQRFVGSSGVLLRAAAAGRPVIAQDYGYLGWLVREHRLGIATATDSPAAIARAIEEVLERGPEEVFDRDRAAAFIAERTPSAFAGPILDRVAGGATAAVRHG